MLRADVIVVERAGFVDGELEHLLRAGREGELADGDDVRRGLDELLDFEADFFKIHLEVFEHVGRNARAFLDEAEQDVFGADVIVVETLGLLPGEAHDFTGAIGEAVKHGGIP